MSALIDCSFEVNDFFSEDELNSIAEWTFEKLKEKQIWRVMN